MNETARQRHDPEAFQCPKCGFESRTHTSRTCPQCLYRGDWVQPGQTLTYAEQKELASRTSDIVVCDRNHLPHARDVHAGFGPRTYCYGPKEA